MKIVLVVPDDLTTVLFCKHIITNFAALPNTKVIVVCDVSHFQADIENLGAEVVNLKTGRTISSFSDLGYINKLTRLLKKEKADIVFNIIAAKQNIYGSIAAKIAGVPAIYSWVNGLGQVFKESGPRGLRFIISSLYRFVFKFNKMVWFNNPADRELFLKEKIIGESKTYLSKFFLDVDDYSADRIVPEKIAYAKEKIGLKENERVVIMVARMLYEKGVKEFCDAAITISATHPDIKFLLVAPMEPNHINSVPESYIATVQEKANLVWTKFEKDVRPFYYLSQLAVLPSYYKEGGYPRALTEPMAMGKPIITTDTDGCRATVEEGKNGFLIPAKDAAALVERINRIMGDDALREKMGAYARVKAMRDFDESVIVPEALREMGLPLPGKNQ